MGFEGGGVGNMIKNETSPDFRFPEVGIYARSHVRNEGIFFADYKVTINIGSPLKIKFISINKPGYLLRAAVQS